LKTGVEWSESFGTQPRLREVPNFVDLRAQPGGGVLTRQDPYAVEGSLRDRNVGGFVQDNWVVAPTLTVDAGVRFDTQRRSTSSVVVSPRGGVTWDPTGNGKNKLFANVGRYYSNVFDSVFGFADSRPAVDTTYLVRNPNATLVGQDTVRSIQRFVIDDLENPYINHASVGYEHLVTPDLKVGITGVVRRGHNQPSSDAVTISQVEVLQVQRTAGTLRYNGVELVLQKAPRHRFEGLVSYTIGKAEDEASGVLSPLQRRFSFGPADYDQRRTFTGTGTITFPGEIRYTTLLRYASGRPFSIVNGDPSILAAFVDRTGQITGRNQEQLPTNWTLDMTVGHEFGSSHGRMRVFGQVINATNRVNVIAVSTQLATAGAPTNVDIPRQIQLGIEFRY
jgi:outer membrane receptor protein involved in Fe transport